MGSKDADSRARLELAQQDLAVASGAEGSTGLPEIARIANEMKQVMQSLIDAGGKDVKAMQKVELMSDDVLENLGKRITPELLKKPEFPDIKAEMFKIAKDLDTLRATTATSVLESYIKTAQDKVISDQEKAAKVHLEQLAASMEGLKEPKNLVPKANEVLDWVQKSHDEAPSSKTVTDMLLRRVMSLSSIILKLKSTWMAGVDSIKDVQKIADRIDEIARKLVVLMETAWDPPIAPQIQHEVTTGTTKLSKQILDTAKKELNDSNVGGTFDALDALRPWWPLVKDIDGVSLELVGLFSKVHTTASQEFISANEDGDSETAQAIRDFAKKFDALRPAFEGLPPPTEAEQRGLAATLDFNQAKATVDKQLDKLSKEYDKATDGDKSTQLSLAITVQALEALVPAWPTVLKEDASYGDRLQKTCGNIESWAVQAATTCGPKKVDGLVKFAENYDDRRRRLSPPEPEAGPLRRRIAEKAAEVHLKGAEAELAKEKGFNVMALLESFRSAVAAFQVDATMTEIQQRLSVALDATVERVVKAHAEALAAGDRRKEDALQQFANDFDEVWNGFKTASGVSGKAGLVARLVGEREKLASERLAAVRDALPSSGVADLKALIIALGALETVWAKLPEGSTVQKELEAALGPLPDCVDRTCKEIASKGDLTVADDLLKQAEKLDSLIPSLAPSLHEDTLKPRVVGTVLEAHLGVMDAEIFNTDGMNCAVLTKELEAVRPYLHEFGCPESSRNHLLDFIAALEAPLLARLASKGGGEAELRVASTADETKKICAAIGKPPTDSKAPPTESKKEKAPPKTLRQKLDGAVAASKKLEEIHNELGKAAGMNPKLVLQALQALEPSWTPVKDKDAFNKRLHEALELFHKKMVEAGHKAQLNEAKVKGLVELAKDADTKQQVFVPLTSGLETRSFCESVQQAVADDRLKAVEAELAKETGMNSEQILKQMTEFGVAWPQLGKADSGPTKDAVTNLSVRAKEVSGKVQSRMLTSFKDALSTENKRKEDALRNFAKEWDTACQPLRESVLAGEQGLTDSLQAEASAPKKEE